MSNINFLLKRSSVASKRPTAAQLDIGELSLNFDQGTPGLFFEDDAGNVRKIGPVEVGGVAPNSTPAGSSGNSIGEMWLDTSVSPNVLKTWDGSSWVDSRGSKGDKGEQGVKGDAGPKGDAGAKGDKGEVGTKGDTGQKGDKGEVGVKGDAGLNGAKGEPGAKGDKGEVGATGDIGAKGDKGEAGATGTTGAKGDKGEVGATGDAGAKGDKGDTGAAGAAGAKGDKGEVGTTGAAGAKGDKGDTGSTGATGEKGDTGAKGDTGTKGDKGDTGSTGAKGDAGATGAKGDKGEVGQKGDAGATGAKGDKGDTGAAGAKGDKGNDGNFGGATFNYTFDSATANSDPGQGKLRLNNATVSSATALYIDDLDDNGTDIQSFLRTIDDSTSTIKGHFRISNRLDASDFALFTISAATENTGYFAVNCGYVSGSATSFTNLEDVIITFARTGDMGAKGDKGDAGAKGDTGSTGAKGDTGVKGDAGSTGATGAKGDKGDAGAKGDTGSKGDKGDTGSTGTAGTKGDKGEVGATGSAGAKGDKGDTGSTGTKGDKGDLGSKGDLGQKGDKGEAGPSTTINATAVTTGTFYPVFVGAAGSNQTASVRTASTALSYNAATNTLTASLNGNASTATTSTNLAGGSAGTLPYQSGAGTTAMLSAGTSGQALLSNGAAAPSWTSLTMENIPGAAYKKSVKAATTANITLSGAQTLDGVAVVAGDRVLVKNQTTASQNGIYVVSSGAWTRALDADSADELGAAIVAVDRGTANGGELWTTTFRTSDTLGTTSMAWYEVLYNTGTWGISTTGTVRVTTSSTASAFKILFANTTASTTGNYSLLQDSEATFTYNPSTNTVTAGTFSGAFSGGTLTATTGSFSGDITMTGTGAIRVANGTTAQRSGSPTNGMVRYNTDLGCVETYVQGAWQVVANTNLDYGLITSAADTTFDYGALV